MLFPDIQKYLKHLPGCGLFSGESKCTCGLAEIEQSLSWTYGYPCSTPGCGKRASVCGKCEDHCECDTGYENDDDE